LISEAAKRLRTSSFVIDGEAVWLDDAGISHFDRLHSRKHLGEVRLVAFDLLSINGDDVRPQPLHTRKDQLARLLATAGDAIQVNPHMEGDVGAAIFQHACKLGLEGIVSKRRDRAYRAGRCTHWVKVKNPDAPAVRRVMEDGA